MLEQVMKGDYSMSISDWSFIIERFFLMDFATVSYRKMVLVWTPKPLDIDYSLFWR